MTREPDGSHWYLNVRKVESNESDLLADDTCQGRFGSDILPKTYCVVALGEGLEVYPRYFAGIC